MKHFAVFTVLFALSAGQVLQVPSSFKNGVKWEFGVSHGDVSARSNAVNANTFNEAPVAPTVYKKELVTPIARKEPVNAVYNKPSADVYKKFVVPTVYRQEPLSVQNVQQQQLGIPTIFKVQPIASNIYKSQPVVHNVVYKQQAAVPIVHKPYPAVSNVYQFKSQPV
ncbi:hypothetical protein ALC56_08555 [Trachymyrmex septentrionalis]|uniref:Uncharacterized protein n=1 Tax=Trachymyrmex septentrionalis TaxID=34720 RepID=A0A195F9N7_9HYME|nr:hypothetical protein ALC56_08555 [Trachymyrmex septentrionalis]